jgi:hypothetical protein
MHTKTASQDEPRQPDSWGPDARQAVQCDHGHWGICDHRQVCRRRRTAREEAKWAISSADGVWDGHPYLGAAGSADPGAERSEHLVARCRDHGRVRPWAGCSASLRRAGGFGASLATTRPRRRDAVEFRCTTTRIQAYSSHMSRLPCR